MTFAIFLGPALIFGASFLNKKSDWKITKFDLFCGSISLLAIVIWFLTKDAMLALILSIVADAIACIPTLIKSWYFPETEDPQAYVFSATSAFITTLSIQTWNFQTYGFPVWTFLICIVFILLVRFKIGRMLQE
jgi:hypothetical protein